MKTSPVGLAALLETLKKNEGATDQITIALNETPDTATAVRIARIGDLLGIATDLLRDEYARQTCSQLLSRVEDGRGFAYAIVSNPPADELHMRCAAEHPANQPALIPPYDANGGAPSPFDAPATSASATAGGDSRAESTASASTAAATASETPSTSTVRSDEVVKVVPAMPTPRARRCTVDGCERIPASGSAVLCLSHLFAQTSADGAVSK